MDSGINYLKGFLIGVAGDAVKVSGALYSAYNLIHDNTEYAVLGGFIYLFGSVIRDGAEALKNFNMHTVFNPDKKVNNIESKVESEE